MEFVKVVMHNPFGSDAYIECYIQITNNEKEVEFLYSILNKEEGFEFCEVYFNDEVDNILKVFNTRYVGHNDVEDYVKLEGKLKIDTNVEIDDADEWWENLIDYPKSPTFENIAEKITYSHSYKNTKSKYNPINYQPKSKLNKTDNFKIDI